MPALAGCGGVRQEGRTTTTAARTPIPEQDVRAVPIGRSPRFKPPAPARRGVRCASGPRFGVHLELFAAGRVVVVPAGIGVAEPRRREGAYVRGACRAALSTTEPTGVLEVRHGTRARLGDLFGLWGQGLGPRRLAGFRGRVRAYVGGRRVPGDPRRIPLTHHAQVVLAVGPDVPVHTAFAFRAGL